MTTPDKDDSLLEAFFDAGRATAPQPSDALLARVLADAEAVQAGNEAVPVPARQGRGPGLVAGLLAALGGWPAVAGLASAAVAGVWVGVVQPDMAAYVGLEAGAATESTGYDLGDIGVGELALAGEF